MEYNDQRESYYDAQTQSVKYRNPVSVTLLDVDLSAIELRVAAQYLTQKTCDMTPAQHERLAMLGEESAEICQMVGKIMRFGFESRHPDGGPTNRDLLIGEIEDLLAVLHMMNEGGDLRDTFADVPAKKYKIERKLNYSRFQP